MVTKISGKRIVFPDGVRAGEIYIENGKIISVGERVSYDNEIAVTDGYVLPGFIDIHTHGACDHDFVSSSPEGIIEAVAYHASHGTTAIMPTISSYGYETTVKALENLELAMQDGKYGRAIIGALTALAASVTKNSLAMPVVWKPITFRVLQSLYRPCVQG